MNEIPELHRVFLAVNNECNSSCVYCANPAKNEPALSGEKIKEIIKDIAAIGAKELVLTGGEPLLRKDLPDIVGYASEHELRTLIATNGMALTPDLLSDIAKPGVRIQISLDSTDRRINDKLRGTGSYDGAMNAINLCLEFEVPLQISTTTTSLNYASIPEVINYAASNGVPVKLRQFVAKGRGDNKKELSVSDRQLEKLLTDFVLKPAYSELVFAEQMPFHQENGIYRCSAGNSIMYIGFDGSVGPCPSVKKAVANINSKSIQEIWKTDFSMFRCKNYKTQGFCGRKEVLLQENKLPGPTGVGLMNYREFSEHGCKCTG